MDVIDEAIVDIMKTHTGIDFQDELYRTLPLFGHQLNIPVRNLVMVYVDIEKRFDIVLPYNDIEDGAFQTFNRISKLVKKCYKS